MATLADTLRSIERVGQTKVADPNAQALRALGTTMRALGNRPLTVEDLHAVKTADVNELHARRDELAAKVASHDPSTAGAVRAMADAVRVAGIDDALARVEKRASVVRALGALSLLRREAR